MPASAALRLTTAAKINLFLRVLGRRADGFHELESIFHTLDLVDDLEVSPLPEGRLEVNIESDRPASAELPSFEDNIVTAAARKLQELAPGRPGAALRVHKRIPIGGGMGGGSSNAAGALLALDRLWQLDLDRAALLQVGAELGSDVPYCLDADGTALVGGRGESVMRLPGPPTPLWFVLGISDEPLLTSQVYGAVVDPSPQGPSAAPVTLALGQGDAGELARLLHNDLEAPALSLRPRLRDDKEALLTAGCLGAVVTGSGPTVVGLVSDRAHAGEVAARVEARFDRVEVASSARSCVTFL